MIKKQLLKLISWLTRLTYEPVTLDKINQKMIKPVPGLIIDGVQYYEFVNIADMPQNRMVHFNYMREEMVMGIDRELQLKFIDQLKKANEERDSNLIGATLYMFEDTLKNLTTIESHYNMASLVYFDDKEDISSYDSDYNERKIKAFKAIKDKSFFFTTLLQKSLNISFSHLEQDMQDYLNENAARLSAWKRMVSEPTA
jgi:hypothetical protein